ncbi:MAG: ligase-associated DNA damage response endonuclease PdeM [Burkholderiaceae bacterium]
MPSHAVVQWANDVVHLLPERALWWPAGQTLFVADLHLGKAASFRAAGLPVPAGSSRDNLDRLSTLIERQAPRQLVFLGDFLHAASGRNAGLIAGLVRWRRRHAQLPITLVRGNHDAHAGDPPPQADITTVEPPFCIGPFAASHHPHDHPTHVVLAGHVHPVALLKGAGRDRLQLPCFVIAGRQAILPAFGAFTGGHRVYPRDDQALYAVGAGRVWRLPTAPAGPH